MAKFMSVASLLFGVLVPLFGTYGDISFNVGPMNVDVANRGEFRRGGGANIENTVCRAIQQQSLLVIFKGGGDKKDETLERLVIEPYALGYNKDGALIIRGFHITDFSIPSEVRKPKEEDKKEAKGGIGFIGGLFVDFKSSSSLTDIKVPDIREIRTLQHSRFKLRSLDDVGKNDDLTQVVCSAFQNAPDDQDSDE